MGKIHIKGGSDLQMMFTDENGNKLEKITLDRTLGRNEPWYTVKCNGIPIQANKRQKDREGIKVDATRHVFRASGDMEVDFESTPQS